MTRENEAEEARFSQYCPLRRKASRSTNEKKAKEKKIHLSTKIHFVALWVVKHQNRFHRDV